MSVTLAAGVGNPDSGCDLLFVYGTLRRRSSHHRILQRLRARFLASGTVRGRLYDLGPFCAATPSAADGEQSAPVRRVLGELYHLQNSARDLKVLDSYEGIRPLTPGQGLIRREFTEVALDHGRTRQAWVYWLNQKPAPVRLISSGNYASS